MVSPLIPPVPPTTSLSDDSKIAMFEQMLVSLQETADYQQKAIAYHHKSLELLQEESANTQSQLELCRSTIATLTKTQQLTPDLSQAEKSSNNGHIEIESKAEPTVKTEKKPDAIETKKAKSNQAKSNSSTKVKSNGNESDSSAGDNTHKKSNSKAKKTKAKKSSTKVSNKLPSSSVLEQYESIKDMVLDYVQKQEGVVAVAEIIKHCYPEGISEPKRKKVYSSFSSVLLNALKKNLVERTVPGKYRWIGK